MKLTKAEVAHLIAALRNYAEFCPKGSAKMQRNDGLIDRFSSLEGTK